MDIKYKSKNVELSINNINNESVSNNEELVKLIELLKGFEKDFLSSSDSNDVVKNISTEKSKVTVSTERPVIRDRLPNQIDLSELEIKKAVTTEPMIRCPQCGQASKTIARISDTENYLLRKVNKKGKDTFETVMQLEDEDAIDKICKPEQADIMDYHNDIIKIKVPAKLRNTDLNVSNDTTLQCPICRGENKFSDWVEAYKHPLDFGFETECLCDVCGHEAVESIDKDKNKVIKCEDCGFTKPAL